MPECPPNNDYQIEYVNYNYSLHNPILYDTTNLLRSSYGRLSYNVHSFKRLANVSTLYDGLAVGFTSALNTNYESLFTNDISKKLIIELSLSLLDILVKDKHSNIKFEFTHDQSIIFSSELLNNKLFAEIFFDENDINEIEVVTNIFKDKKQIKHLTGGFNESIEFINDFSKNQNKEYRFIPSISSSAEELSIY
jgi:hypothetical protein